MTSSLRFAFENGYTTEIVDHLVRTFDTEIENGKLTDGVMAYHLALYALTFQSAADRFVENLGRAHQRMA